MERRKIIHHICANVMGTETASLSSINTQVSSGATAAYPAVSANVSSIQSTLGAMKSTLDTWYTAWRGTEAAEPPEPAFLGVFGSVSSFTSELDETTTLVKLVRNDYTVLSMLAMAYEELYSIALAYETEAPGLKTIALDGLKDLVPLIESVSETMCTITIQHLHSVDDDVPLSLAAAAVAATQTIWDE